MHPGVLRRDVTDSINFLQLVSVGSLVVKLRGEQGEARGTSAGHDLLQGPSVPGP